MESLIIFLEGFGLVQLSIFGFEKSLKFDVENFNFCILFLLGCQVTNVHLVVIHLAYIKLLSDNNI